MECGLKNLLKSCIIVHQNDYRSSGEQARQKAHKDFCSVRGKLSYAASLTRPDISFATAALSQVTEPIFNDKHFNLLNKTVKKLNTLNGIIFKPLDLSSLYIAGYADASFANNYDISAQLGSVIVLKDKYDNATIIQYGSWKCRRVTRSVFGAEIYAFSQTMDFVLALSNDLSKILSRKIRNVVYTDSKSLFDTITKFSLIYEKRMLIDIADIRQSYTKRKLSNVAHILSQYNIADSFTKEKTDMTLLNTLMKSGKLSHLINQ